MKALVDGDGSFALRGTVKDGLPLPTGPIAAMQPSLLGRLQSRRLGAPQKGSLGSNAQANRPPVGDGLRGWACWTRTGESVRELFNWNCLTTLPSVGASWAAAFAYKLRENRFGRCD
jgi:hypothetical protein